MIATTSPSRNRRTDVAKNDMIAKGLREMIDTDERLALNGFVISHIVICRILIFHFS
jgi:hypothetical protein